MRAQVVELTLPHQRGLIMWLFALSVPRENFALKFLMLEWRKV